MTTLRERDVLRRDLRSPVLGPRVERWDALSPRTGWYGSVFTDPTGGIVAARVAVALHPITSRRLGDVPPSAAFEVVRQETERGRGVLPCPDRDPSPLGGALGAGGVHLHVVADVAPDEATRARLAHAFRLRHEGLRIVRITAEAGSVAPWEAPPYPEPRAPLSGRERRLLFHRRNGLPDAEIAARIFLSPGSMRTTTARILAKLEGEIGEGPDRRRSLDAWLRANPHEVWPDDRRI